MRTSRSVKRNRIGKPHDQGFSLVELVVVIAIMAVLGGLFITGLNLIFGLPSRECARELKSELEKVRTDAMGKTEASLYLYKAADGIYFRESYHGFSPDEKQMDETGSKRAPVKIGNDRVTLKYLEKSEDPSLLEGSLSALEAKCKELDAAGITLHWNRETGGFISVGEDVCLRAILVQSGGHTWRLTLHEMTGVVDLERAE